MFDSGIRFFELMTEGKIQQPYYTSPKTDEPMAMAGLWEPWAAPKEKIDGLVAVYPDDGIQAWQVSRRTMMWG